MSAVVRFLLARLDEDEEGATAATQGPWRHVAKNVIETPGIDVTEADWGRYEDDGVTLLHDYRIHCARDQGAWKEEDAEHIARHDPARVLAEVAAKRAIVEHFDRLLTGPEDGDEGSATVMLYGAAAILCAIRHLAAAYADHPEYRREWAP